VHVAHNGDEALEFLRRQGPFAQAPRPAIVLLDINMPGRNGFEVLSEMRSDAVLRRIPVVMLTTSTREADVAAAYEGGACSFIAKPVSLDDLRDLLIHFIRYWLRVARLPRQEG
jgi:CheY-like chemotaxis protein